jgi:hypothetical protein
MAAVLMTQFSEAGLTKPGGRDVRSLLDFADVFEQRKVLDAATPVDPGGRVPADGLPSRIFDPARSKDGGCVAP